MTDSSPYFHFNITTSTVQEKTKKLAILRVPDNPARFLESTVSVLKNLLWLFNLHVAVVLAPSYVGGTAPSLLPLCGRHVMANGVVWRRCRFRWPTGLPGTAQAWARPGTGTMRHGGPGTGLSGLECVMPCHQARWHASARAGPGTKPSSAMSSSSEFPRRSQILSISSSMAVALASTVSSETEGGGRGITLASA